MGVTDEVMDTLWQCGPWAASYAVSAGAETHHVGADIAILRPGTTQIIHYQAKLAWLNGGSFQLKSPVTQAQVQKLNRRTVRIQGVTYGITGRLALYQANTQPFLRSHCPDCDPWSSWRFRLCRPPVAPTPDPRIGRDYYEHVLMGCRCSPSGIVAAPVPPRENDVISVAERGTWPWEFDLYEWTRQNSRLDQGGNTENRAPEFEEYRLVEEQPSSQAQVDEIATELAQRLRLPASQRLYLIILP